MAGGGRVRARGLAVLIAGNLTILSAPALLARVPSEQTSLTEDISVQFGPAWYDQEHLEQHTWRWARGPATLIVRNPNPRPFTVTLDLGLRSIARRTVTVSTWQLQKGVVLEAGQVSRCRFGPLVLPPGNTVVSFASNEPAEGAPGDARRLMFAAVDLFGDVAP